MERDRGLVERCGTGQMQYSTRNNKNGGGIKARQGKKENNLVHSNWNILVDLVTEKKIRFLKESLPQYQESGGHKGKYIHVDETSC